MIVTLFVKNNNILNVCSNVHWTAWQSYTFTFDNY